MKENEIRSAIDDGLRDLRMDEAQRVKMLAKIMHNEEEIYMKKPTKRRISAAAVVLVAALMTVTAAFAAQSWGWVNWNGEWEDSNLAVLVEPTPTPEGAEMQQNIDMDTLVSQVPDGELWMVRDATGGTGRHGAVGKTAETLADVAECFAGKPMLIPEIPEGYVLRFVELSYNRIALSEGIEPYATETIGEYTLEKYKLREATDDDLTGYSADFFDEKGNKLAIHATLYRKGEVEPDDESGGFFVDETETFELLNIDGFEHALMITREDGARDIHLQTEVDGEYFAQYYIYTQAEIDVTSIFKK